MGAAQSGAGSADSALVLATKSSTEVAAAGRPRRYPDLPVMLANDLDRLVGMVPLVRMLGALCALLGSLAIMVCVSIGSMVLASVATVMTGLILYALFEDTRLVNALELIRRRKHDAAEVSLARIATSSRRSPWQQQRARTFLAALSWRRGDAEQSLQWIEARLAGRRPDREDPWHRWLARATHVQLLAVVGRAADARAALAKLPEPPPEEQARRVAADTALLVAFVSDDPDAVRDRLDAWEPAIRARSDGALSVALLAWANAGRGDRDRALALTRIARERDTDGLLERRYPRIWQWVERYDSGFHYGR